jgi:hypothetical protein
MEHVFVIVNRLATDAFPRGILAATPPCRPRPDLTTPDREPTTLNIFLAYFGLYDIPE